MWDNTENKKNPKAPDHKCKNKDCTGVVWPPRKPKTVNNVPVSPGQPDWPQPDSKFDTKIPTPIPTLGNDLKLGASRDAAYLIGKYMIGNPDMSTVDIRDEWEKVYKFILSEITK
jgi:hypothetical protein